MDKLTTFKKKVNKNSKSYISWVIIISSLLVAITLLISWTLFFTIFKNKINEVILIINIIITRHNFNLNLNFNILTGIIWGFAIGILLLVTLPFMFIKNQGALFFILPLIMLLLIIGFFTVSGLFYFYGFCAFFCPFSKIIDNFFFIIPWCLELICGLILGLFCLWLLIIKIITKNKSSVSTTEDVIKKPAAASNDNSAEITSEADTTLSEENAEKAVPKTPAKIDSSPDATKQNLENTPAKIDSSPDATNTSSEESQVKELPKPQNINIVITNNTAISEPRNKKKPTIESEKITTHNLPNNNHNQIIWTANQIEAVWNKGEIIFGYNPKLYRKDYAGALMFRDNFINHIQLNDDPKSYYWTIVHQRPLSKGGTNDISNLWPLNNTNAISKGNNYPRWKTAISYDGKKNVLKQKSWKDKT